MPTNKKNLIWIDLEMTGLDPKFNRIIEIAILITNSDLEILAEGPVLAIYQNELQLSTMNSWNLRVHTATGLIDRVKNSKYDEAMAEKEMLSFLIQWVPKGKSPMCGNGIGQDRRFLYQYMPKLEEYFHYRYLDVSSLKELAFRWKPEILKGLKKKSTHKAIEDVRESVQELIYYRENFLML